MLKRAYIEITNVCNLRCSFCPGTGRKGEFMTPERFRRLAEKLRGHVKYLYLHVMGEPMLHPWLGELLAIAADLDFRTCLTTNGRCWGSGVMPSWRPGGSIRSAFPSTARRGTAWGS